MIPATQASTACGAPVTIAAGAEDELVAAAPADALALLTALEALETAALAELDAELAAELTEDEAEEAAALAELEAELALLDTEPAAPVANAVALAGFVDVATPMPEPPVAVLPAVPPPLAIVF